MPHTLSKFYQKNAIIYVLNVILFSLIFVFKPSGANYGIGLLLLLLILSLAFIPQLHTERNIGQIGNFRIVNSNSIIMLLIYANLSFLHWTEYQVLEKVYLIVFCLIQICLIQIQRLPKTL